MHTKVTQMLDFMCTLTMNLSDIFALIQSTGVSLGH